VRTHDGLRHDIRIVSYDMRGHGQSDESPIGAATIVNLARDLSGVIDTYVPRGMLVLSGTRWAA